jgi:hypothetical protein
LAGSDSLRDIGILSFQHCFRFGASEIHVIDRPRIVKPHVAAGVIHDVFSEATRRWGMENTAGQRRHDQIGGLTFAGKASRDFLRRTVASLMADVCIDKRKNLEWRAVPGWWIKIKISWEARHLHPVRASPRLPPPFLTCFLSPTYLPPRPQTMLTIFECHLLSSFNLYTDLATFNTES